MSLSVNTGGHFACLWYNQNILIFVIPIVLTRYVALRSFTSSTLRNTIRTFVVYQTAITKVYNSPFGDNLPLPCVWQTQAFETFVIGISP